MTCVGKGFVKNGSLFGRTASTTLIVTSCCATPPRPSLTRTVSVCGPACAAVGVQVIRPVSPSMASARRRAEQRVVQRVAVVIGRLGEELDRLPHGRLGRGVDRQRRRGVAGVVRR